MRALWFAVWLMAGCGPEKVACLDEDAAPTSPDCAGQDGCCSFSWSVCEDGVNYALTCDSRTLPTTCTCAEDGVPTESFTAEGYTCPPNFEVPRIETVLPFANDGCGWGLQ